MTIPLSDTTISTMNEFFVWTFSPQPHIDDRLDFADVTKLGIFAWKYQIASLSNQVTDMIRGNLATGEWQLQAELVDDIYQAAPAKSPLREVIRGALGQLPRETVDGEEWEGTFKKHAELGWDYIKAGGKDWTRQEYLTDVCRFHNHEGINRPQGLCDGCPFAQEDCYPRWGEKEDDGKDAQASNEQDEYVPKHDEIVEEGPKEEQTVEETPVDTPQVDGTMTEEPKAEEPEKPKESEAMNEEIEGNATPVIAEEAEPTLPPASFSEEYVRAEEQDESEEALEDATGTDTPHHETVNGMNMNGTSASTAMEYAPSESMFGDGSTVAPDSMPSDLEGPVMEANLVIVKDDRKHEATMMVKSASVIESESPKPPKKKGGKKKQRQSFSHPIR